VRTILSIILLVMLSVFLFGPIALCRAADLPETAVKNAHQYLKLREKTGNNDSPEIDRMLAYLGLPKHLSWCAAFSIYNYYQAAEALHVKQPFPKYGRVAMLRQACINNPLKYRYITADEVRLGSVYLSSGDLPLWAHGTIRGGDFNGHTGLVIQQLSPRSFQSIEGNTSSGSKGSQNNGNGVFIRERQISPGTFRILGFCRVRE